MPSSKDQTCQAVSPVHFNLFETRPHQVSQPGFEFVLFLTQQPKTAEIIGMCHCIWLKFKAGSVVFIKCVFFSYHHIRLKHPELNYCKLQPSVFFFSLFQERGLSVLQGKAEAWDSSLTFCDSKF